MLSQIGRYYAQPRMSSVIYNGRTPSLFHSRESKDHLITTVGRLWDAGKNAALLSQDELPWPVCVVGSDKPPATENSFQKQQECCPGVQLLPQQNEEQLRELLGGTAIYAAVSRYEPFGLAPVEAALSGCAVLASDIESFRELWDDAAIFFRNNDPASLRQALNALTEDSNFRQSCAKRAYDHARKWFAADRMLHQYVDFYRTLMQQVERPAFFHDGNMTCKEISA